MNSAPPLARLILYVHDMPAVATFYQTYFGYRGAMLDATDVMHLSAPGGGCALTLLPASKGHRRGQSQVKLVFEVADVDAFKQESATRGLQFGVTHRGGTYAYANARDPAQNLIQVSSRGESTRA